MLTILNLAKRMSELTLQQQIDGLPNLEKRLKDGQASHEEVTQFLVTHFYTKVHRLALSIVQQSAEADDIAQKSLIKAANKIESYESGTNLKSWVYRITVNEARMALRRSRARNRLVKLLTLGSFTSPHPIQPEALVIRNERDFSLWKAVSQLPDKQKLPILLRYSFECTDQEISEILNIPHGTVRSRLHHAHKQLLYLLKEKFHDSGTYKGQK